MKLFKLISLTALSLPTMALAQWDYEVLFTKPTCPAQNFVDYRPPAVSETYERLLDEASLTAKPNEALLAFDELPRTTLPTGIETIGGSIRQTIPAGVFCDDDDREASLVRAEDSAIRDTDSPYLRVFDWLDTLKPGDKAFVASMSFSSNEVATALCAKAVAGVEVKVFLHEPGRPNTAFTILQECQTSEGSAALELIQYPKGRERLAHMKTIVLEYLNPQHDAALQGKVRYTFQSANLSSSGLWGHHENWSFITSTNDHWLAQDHLCLRDTVSDENLSDLNNFYTSLTRCRDEKNITSRRLVDQDIQAFFTPVFSNAGYNDRRALRTMLAEELGRSQKVQIAIHHLTDRQLLAALEAGLRAGDFELELLLDDDLFWTDFASSSRPYVDENERRYYEPLDYSRRCDWGKTRDEAERCFTIFRRAEYLSIRDYLIAAGARVKYIEANHLGFKLFHHKFMIFTYRQPVDGYRSAVFTGAGNFSKSGFERNFENYYLVRRPGFVEAFKINFERLFQLGVDRQQLPITWDYSTRDILD